MPDDLATLFDRDPLNLTDQDLDTIIAEYRAKRAAFQIKPARGSKAPEPLLKEPIDLDKLFG